MDGNASAKPIGHEIFDREPPPALRSRVNQEFVPWRAGPVLSAPPAAHGASSCGRANLGDSAKTGTSSAHETEKMYSDFEAGGLKR